MDLGRNVGILHGFVDDLTVLEGGEAGVDLTACFDWTNHPVRKQGLWRKCHFNHQISLQVFQEDWMN
jgi:hypothetical protein